MIHNKVEFAKPFPEPLQPQEGLFYRMVSPGFDQVVVWAYRRYEDGSIRFINVKTGLECAPTWLKIGTLVRIPGPVTITPEDACPTK